VHANVDGEDFVGAPVWHAGSDEHRAAAQLLGGSTVMSVPASSEIPTNGGQVK
jgi:hypothetical protein